MKSTSALLAASLLLGCGQGLEDQASIQRLEDHRQRYSKLIENDFPASLFRPEVDQLLDELRSFSGSKDRISEARGLLDQIEADRRRFGKAGPKARSVQEMLAQAKSSKPPEPTLKGKDELEQIWLQALNPGSSLAEFDRYWKPCFYRDPEDPQRHHRTGHRSCMSRSHYAGIESVVFRRGRLAELIERVRDPRPSDAGPN